MTVDEINIKLKQNYGTSPLKDEAIFRIVWSTRQIEYRKGIHGDFDIVETVKQVQKYNYVLDRFILEKLVYIGQQRELVNVSGFSYEPVYVFQDKHGNPLPVEWWAVEYAVKSLLGQLGSAPRRNEYMDHQAQEDRVKAEELEIYDKLSHEGSKPFETGSATFLDSTKRQYFEE